MMNRKKQLYVMSTAAAAGVLVFCWVIKRVNLRKSANKAAKFSSFK